MLMKQFVDKLNFIFTQLPQMCYLIHLMKNSCLKNEFCSLWFYDSASPSIHIFLCHLRNCRVGTLGIHAAYVLKCNTDTSEIYSESLFSTFSRRLFLLQLQSMDFLFIPRVVHLSTINLLLMASAITYPKNQNKYQLQKTEDRLKSNSNHRAGTF